MVKDTKDMDSFEFTKELFINTGILVVPEMAIAWKVEIMSGWFSTEAPLLIEASAFEGGLSNILVEGLQNKRSYDNEASGIIVPMVTL